MSKIKTMGSNKSNKFGFAIERAKNIIVKNNTISSEEIVSKIDLIPCAGGRVINSQSSR
jgi:hypothetical protein